MYVVWRLQSVWSPIAAGSGAGDVIAVSVFTLHTHDHAEFARHTGQQSSVATLFAQLSQKGACPHGSSVNPSHHATRHTSQQQWALSRFICHCCSRVWRRWSCRSSWLQDGKAAARLYSVKSTPSLSISCAFPSSLSTPAMSTSSPATSSVLVHSCNLSAPVGLTYWL